MKTLLRCFLLFFFLAASQACSRTPVEPLASTASPLPASATPFFTRTYTPTPSLTPTLTPAPTATATLTPTPTAQLLALPDTPIPPELPPLSPADANLVSGLASFRVNTVTDLTWTPDGRTLVVAHLDGIAMFDPLTRNLQRELYPVGAGVISLDFSPDGSWLAVGSQYGSEQESYAGNLQLWLGPYWKPLGILHGQQRAVSQVKFSQDSRLLGIAFTEIGFADDSVDIWSTATWEITRTLKTGQTLQIDFSPDGRYLASTPDRYSIQIWDLRTGKMLNEIFTSFTGEVSSMAFSPGGLGLATGHYDGTVAFWNIADGSLIWSAQGQGVIEAIDFHPDGKFLATGESWDLPLVRLWDAEDGEELRSLEGHENGITALAFSPGGDRLASGSYDGSLWLWGIRP